MLTTAALASANRPAMTEPPTASRPSDTPVDLSVDFEALYRREFPALIGVATALSGLDGEDLVQDTMVRAWMRWDTVSRLERPGGWCHKVLVNLCHGRWRRRLVEARYLARLRRSDTTTDGPSEDVVAFWSAVRTLPERQRLVMALRYAGDLSTVEVAAVLGVPEGTVRSDLNRARAVLATQWEA